MIFIYQLRTAMSPHGGTAPNFPLMLAATRPSKFVYATAIAFSKSLFPYAHRESAQDHSTLPGRAACAPLALKARQVTVA